MIRVLSFIACILAVNSQAVWYDDHELNHELNQAELLSTTRYFTQIYFTSHSAESAIEKITTAELTPLQREYVFFNLLTEISQQPPQEYHQYFINLMKNYSIEATKTADEGPFPVAVFNLKSKAHGIENIWLAYRTEQRFNSLLNNNMKQALADINDILADPTPQQRPQWLGIKNSITALSAEKLTALTQHLQHSHQDHGGLDRLISHVGLFTANLPLTEKALAAEQQSIREFTLRNLPHHFSREQTKTLLLNAAKNSKDMKISTSLLSQFSNDKVIQTFLVNQLNNKVSAENAAFALSQSSDPTLPPRLKTHYLQTEQSWVKNHVLLALKLNRSSAAKLALADLSTQLEPDSKGRKWLNSFAGEQQ